MMLKDDLQDFLSKLTREWKAARAQAFQENIIRLTRGIENPVIEETKQGFVFYLDDHTRLREALGYTTWIQFQRKILGFWITTQNYLRDTEELARIYK